MTVAVQGTKKLLALPKKHHTWVVLAEAVVLLDMAR